MPQSTLTTSSPSSLKNNLQPPYKPLSFFFFLSMQLQLQIWTSYIKTSSQLSLVTQSLQNTSLQMAGDLQIQMVYSFLTTGFIYHLLVTSTHVFSSIIMIISLLNILVKTKHWNQSAMDTPSPAFVLMYNNSASSISLACDPSHNITSSTNSIFIDFIEKLSSFSRFNTILVIVNQLTKQAIFIPVYDTITFINLAYLFIIHIFSKHSVPSHVISNRGLEFVSDFFYSLSTALNMWLHFT